MSLYNLLFGMNPDSGKLLELLGKTQEDFGRFRNVFIEDGYIVVHTRNGGGNREDYEHVFDEMSEHPWYSHDADDDFDCTYANIYFRLPSEDRVMVALQGLHEGQNPSEQWSSMLDSLTTKTK